MLEGQELGQDLGLRLQRSSSFHHMSVAFQGCWEEGLEKPWGGWEWRGLPRCGPLEPLGVVGFPVTGLKL